MKLRTLLVPIVDLETEISVYPNEQSLKSFCESNDVDIILVFSKQTADATFCLRHAEGRAEAKVWNPAYS